MADQGKWFKLHVGWDDDPHISSLSLQDQARWCKFGTYMKEHGTEGAIVLVDPAKTLQHRFEVSGFDEVLNVLRMFPNYEIGEKHKRDGEGVTCVTVTIKNWNRYQGDFSRDRMRKLRHHVTAKKRGEEKRGDENRREEIRRENVNTLPDAILKGSRKAFIPPTPEAVAAYAKEQGFQIDAVRFVNHYGAAGWMRGKTKITNWKLCANTWKNSGGTNGTRTNSHVRLNQTDPERVGAYEG